MRWGVRHMIARKQGYLSRCAVPVRQGYRCQTAVVSSKVPGAQRPTTRRPGGGAALQRAESSARDKQSEDPKREGEGNARAGKPQNRGGGGTPPQQGRRRR